MKNSNKSSTKQEKFWFGQFGKDYTSRNQSKNIVAYNTALFAKVLNHTNDVNSLIEFGAGSGNNLKAIRNLKPDIKLAAVEINNTAVLHLKKIPNLTVFHQSIFDIKLKKKWNLSLTKGVLIHINPDKLKTAYQLLYDSSDKYICLMEYYNPTPVQVDYRGNQDYLFKRDFAGEMLDIYKDLTLLEYGFVYHRDCNFPLDDISWFLLKKK